MSALDDHFGTKTVGHTTNYSAEGPNRLLGGNANKRSSSTESSRLTTGSRRTAFPRAEERIRPILDAFLAEVRKLAGEDYTPPSIYRGRWTAGARDLAQVLKADPWLFMPWAFAKHMRAFPDGRPDSPRSLLYLVERYPKRLELCRHCGQVPEYCVCDQMYEESER